MDDQSYTYISVLCPAGCKNGNCVNGSCVCFEGYILGMGSTSNCVPVCINGCRNGKCTSPDICECDPGYRLVENVCKPRCSQECIGGFCAAPEQCGCERGYAISQVNPFLCVPVCKKECIGGACIEPGICQCYDGFELNEDGFTCSATCKVDCIRGNCSYGSCECEEGWFGEACNELVATVEEYQVKERYILSPHCLIFAKSVFINKPQVIQ